MKNKNNKKRLKLRPRTTQKFKMRYKVIATSIFGLIMVTFIYLNFSQSEISKASDSDKGYRVSYQTTDIIVPVRMLRDASAIERSSSSENSEIKEGNSKISRSTDFSKINAQ